MTKRAAFVAVIAIAALALAACGSSGKSSTAKSNTPKATTTTLSPKKAAAATEIATRLGCKKPKAAASNFPVRSTTVVCTAGGIEYHVTLYERAADLSILTGAGGVKLSCAVAKAMHINGPLYVIKGNNFSVQALKVGNNNSRAQPTLAQTKTISSKLGASVLTTPCTT